MSVLALEGLEVSLDGTSLLDGVGFTLEPASITALVGESGSGKSVTALALCGLLPAALRARWRLLSFDGRAVDDPVPLRGRGVALMPQDALASLDPVMRVGHQIDEVLGHVAGVGPADRRSRRESLLREVGFSEPATIATSYPHQLSGGMRQRALLAATLAAEPRVLIADEPTTALDASLRQGVLTLLRELTTRRRLAMLFITHDLAAVEAIADQVTVLYAGRVAEQGAAKTIFSSPRHPYTAGLLAARLDGNGPARVLPGSLPSVGERPVGCRFSPRCARRSAQCAEQPALVDGVACHHPTGAA
ncbi:MAG: ABC transporter ATP-binding protein [Archangiaceae bacterium]|nr:ABC transporter ATP-binding protein [Archangiaceae bacterium]